MISAVSEVGESSLYPEDFEIKSNCSYKLQTLHVYYTCLDGYNPLKGSRFNSLAVYTPVVVSRKN